METPGSVLGHDMQSLLHLCITLVDFIKSISVVKRFDFFDGKAVA